MCFLAPETNRGSFFGKLIGSKAPEMVPWLSKKSADQSGGPRTHFGGISKKHENRVPRCHVRPNPAKVRGDRIAWSMPCPQTPPDLPNTISVFRQFLLFFWPYKTCFCTLSKPTASERARQRREEKRREEEKRGEKRN